MNGLMLHCGSQPCLLTADLADCTFCRSVGRFFRKTPRNLARISITR